MGYFAGLDVSLEETALCIVDDAGRIIREARVASEPETLVAFFGACGMTMDRVGLEACSLTAWLHAGLTEAGIPAICIEARQAKAAMGAMPNKTDRNDARGIAHIMRTGWYRAVHVKSPSCRSWRALLTARRMVLNKRRDVENGIRALLREVGLKVGTPSRKDFPARVRELAADEPLSMPVEFSPKAPAENSPLRFGSITAITTGRDDRCKVFEIEFDDGLKRLGGWAVAQAFGQGVRPGGVFGLQGEQVCNGVAPALGAAAPIGGPSVAHHRRLLLGELAGAISGLAFGVAQGVFAFGLATSWHGAFSVT